MTHTPLTKGFNPDTTCVYVNKVNGKNRDDDCARDASNEGESVNRGEQMMEGEERRDG